MFYSHEFKEHSECKDKPSMKQMTSSVFDSCFWIILAHSRVWKLYLCKKMISWFSRNQFQHIYQRLWTKRGHKSKWQIQVFYVHVLLMLNKLIQSFHLARMSVVSLLFTHYYWCTCGYKEYSKACGKILWTHARAYNT